MGYITGHFVDIVSVLLCLSESGAALSQVLFPDNKGVSGGLAFVIKMLQNIKDKQSL